MMPSMSMANLIALMRMRKSMKQTLIWDITGISEVTISRIINSRQTISAQPPRNKKCIDQNIAQ